jgi:Zinc finger, ZZ type
MPLTRALREYVHFGIGCDCCGAFPLRGKRFKCLDCPEAVGFDLCEACHRGGLVTYGRFNQRHIAGEAASLPGLHT